MKTERHYTKIDILLELVCLIGIAVILFSFRTDIYNFLLPLMAFNGQIDYRGYSTAVILSIFIPLFLISVIGILLDSAFWRIKVNIRKEQKVKDGNRAV